MSQDKQVRAKLTRKHPKTGIHVTGESVDALIVDEYRTLSYDNPVLQTLVENHPEWVDVENPPSQKKTDVKVDLTELTVLEQQERLENLTREDLEELREDEDRKTALQNIDKELRQRRQA